jgi:hypothetical protein
VAVQDLDLGHGLDNLEAIVRLLGQRVAEKVELFEEGELREVLQEDVEVAKLVVADQKHLQELSTCRPPVCTRNLNLRMPKALLS